MQKTLLMVGLSLILMGCTSQPKEVNASLSLVAPQSPVGDVVPNKYVNFLNNQEQQAITTNGVTIQTKDVYFSALGNKCRELHIMKSNKMQTRSVCFYEEGNTKEGHWYLVPSIIKPAIQVTF